MAGYYNAAKKIQATAILEAEAEAAKKEGRTLINLFRGEYSFLSNFYEVPVEYDGYVYKSSEAAFQAQKCPTLACKFATMNATDAKAYGRKVSIRKDWEQVKCVLMYNILIAKFSQNPHLKEKLLATGDSELVEGNWWGDKFWGVCNGVGKNMLGKTLMQVRSDLQE